MNEILLTILLPTYNRADDIIYNLSLLETYINKNVLGDKISIIISNNGSTDKTEEKIQAFIQKSRLKIELYNQKENIGLENNALFTLEKATSEYIMFLGDDDYLDEQYLVKVVKIIEHEKNITCIIPSFIGINSNKTIISNSSRDIDLKTRTYKKGFESCLELSWRGHQLSGLVCKREGLYLNYKSNNVHNIYPFIFFVAFSILNGDSYHLTNFPVLVTQIGQEKKDWGYGNDGLISHVFDNYKKLNITNSQRFALEIRILKEQPIRYMMYLEKNKCAFLRAIYNIMTGENTSIKTSILFPFLLLWIFFKKILRYPTNLLRRNKE